MSKFDKQINEYIELTTVPGLGNMIPIDTHSISARPEDTFPNGEVRMDVVLPRATKTKDIKKILRGLIKSLKKAK